VGILLGVLFAVVSDFRTLIYVFVFYTLVDLFLWKLRKDEIAGLIENSAQTLERDFSGIADEAANSGYRRNVLDIFRQGADLLKEYYLARNHYGRVGIQLIVVAILAICPLLWEWLYQARALKDFTPDGITMVGYLLFIWCISISEVTVYIWRQDLDARLAALGKRLYELEATKSASPASA
jgi:hypothetical protein